MENKELIFFSSTFLLAFKAFSKNLFKNFDSLIRPSGSIEESLKKLRSTYPPFGRSWRLPWKSSSLLSTLRAVLKSTVKIFVPLIRPSDVLEESLKHFEPLVHSSGGIEESLRNFQTTHPPFGRSWRIPQKKIDPFIRPSGGLQPSKLQPSKTPLKHQPYHPPFRLFSNIPLKIRSKHLALLKHSWKKYCLLLPFKVILKNP